MKVINGSLVALKENKLNGLYILLGSIISGTIASVQMRI